MGSPEQGGRDYPPVQALRQSRKVKPPYTQDQDIPTGMIPLYLVEGATPFPAPMQFSEIRNRLTLEGRFDEADRNYPNVSMEKAENFVRDRFNFHNGVVIFRNGAIDQLLKDELEIIHPPPARSQVLVPGPSFPEFKRHVDDHKEGDEGSMRYTPIEYPLTSHLDEGLLYLEDFIKRDKFKNKVVYICNPGTKGDVASPRAIEGFVEFAARNGILTLVDEAGADVLPDEDSAISLTDYYPNLIVNRGLSKTFGWQGKRIGYAVASPGELAERLREFMIAYPIAASDQVLINEIMDPGILVPHAKMVAEKHTNIKSKLREKLRNAGFEDDIPTNDRVPYMLIDGKYIKFWRNLKNLSVAAVPGSAFYETHSQMNDSIVRITIPSNPLHIPLLVKRLKYAKLVAEQSSLAY